jgi:DNA-binding GntR family transcriptional regulator
MIDEIVPDAPPVPSFDYSRVVEALAGSAGTPHMLTIAAQLAAMLRARIGCGEFAPNQPIPGESTLIREYGVARETVRKAVCALVAEGLVHVVEGRGAYVATCD